MSQWMRLINELKTRRPEDYLMPTQQVALKELHQMLLYPQTLNIYGPKGCGKTVLAWASARQLNAAYFSLPSQVSRYNHKATIMFVDNAPTYENDVRRVMSEAELRGARSIILITRPPVEMPMRSLHLSALSSEESMYVQHTWQGYGFYSNQHLPPNPNLWDILHIYCQ